MFDATAGKTASAKRIEDLSNQFAADVTDALADPSFSRQEQEDLLAALAAVVANRADAKSLAAGTYAQARANNGAPAQALGAGSSGTNPQVEAQNALQLLLSADDTIVPKGSKQLLRRALTPGDPEYIQVDGKGTPVAIVSLEAELKKTKDERDKAVETLKNERDKSVAGSLAHKLEAELNKPAPTAALPADMVKKGDIKPLVDKLSPLTSARQSNRPGSTDTVVPRVIASDIKSDYQKLAQAVN